MPQTSRTRRGTTRFGRRELGARLGASLDFYIPLGYGKVGHVDIGGDAEPTMLRFPGEVATLELVHQPAGEIVDIGTIIAILAPILWLPASPTRQE